MTDQAMSDAFRTQCESLHITDSVLNASLARSNVSPKELLSIDVTTSARNFKVNYINKAGEPKWIHLFIVVPPVDA